MMGWADELRTIQRKYSRTQANTFKNFILGQGRKPLMEGIMEGTIGAKPCAIAHSSRGPKMLESLAVRAAPDPLQGRDAT